MSIPFVDKLKTAKILFLMLFTSYQLLITFVAFAQVPTLPKVRITYRPDEGVSITSFVAGACQGGETETQCMDREMQKNPALADLPHDDVDPTTLPQDRKERNKWRGSKGQGISIDHSLVTKQEKIEELKQKLDEELDKNNPSSIKVAKINRLIEKVKDYKDENGLIKPEDLSKFEDKKQSILASVVEIVTSSISSAFDGILTSIQNGFLALKKLTTNTIQIGSPEMPSGITTYDQTTKQPYCIVVKDGQIQNIPGECGASSASVSTPVQTEPATDTSTTSLTP